MRPIPYYPISQFYRERFGMKVHKISVSVADTCPNREGLRGMQTCNFCDQWGSAAYAKNLEKPLKEQIEEVRETVRLKRRAEKFLIYFQAYTTTFSKVSKLREQFELALSYPDVVGLVVGTRPDCVSGAFLDACNEMSKRTFMAVEMGVQSFDNEMLKWMRRGHTIEQSEKAIELIASKCPDVNLGIHLIFGNPGETEETVIEAAKRTNFMPIHNVKLHHMHVLKNTPLADDFAAGLFTPMEQQQYFHHCTLFLQHLRKDIAVHRLAAFSSRWDELIAPKWTTFKMEMYQGMLSFMRERGAYQGQHV
jgi:radical SAM protein (TIGR01212 family)